MSFTIRVKRRVLKRIDKFPKSIRKRLNKWLATERLGEELIKRRLQARSE